MMATDYRASSTTGLSSATTHAGSSDSTGSDSSRSAWHADDHTPRQPASAFGPAIPRIPPVGLDPHIYDKLAREAEKCGDHHAHEAAKVCMYITLGMDPHLSWLEKLRYFKHALNRHCNPPTIPTQPELDFYAELAVLVRKHCGNEVLKLASKEDDFYAARLAMGQTREQIGDDAEVFFEPLLGHATTCPVYYTEEDWQTLKMIRDQWV